MRKKISSAFFNVFYFKIALMVMLIPTLLVYCTQYNYKLLMIMLGWGAIVCLYDFFVRRTFVKARGMLWLIAFLASFMVSVLLNFRTGLSLNITNWGYTAIALFLLYPDGATKDRTTALRELSVINNIFIGMNALFSTVSLGMFITLYTRVMVFGGQKYYIGWANNRLFGLYANTGYMITAIGLAIIAIQWAVLRAKDGKVSVPYKIFLIYTAVVNFLSMCMENAKGAFLSLAAFCAVGGFFLVLRWFRVRKKNIWLSFGTAVLTACVSVAVLFGAISVTRPLLAYVPAIYWDIKTQPAVQKPEPTEPTAPTESTTLPDEATAVPTPTESEPTPTEPKKEPLQGIIIDRNIDESYGNFTGRPQIWKFGLQEFLKKPIFGFGSQSHREIFIVDNYLRHFHNLIVQSLVSVGAVGSILIFAFFLTLFIFLLKKLFVLVSANRPAYSVAALLMAFLAMLLLNSMAEVTVLFIIRYGMFMFWIYLGYLIPLLSDGEKASGTKLLESANDAVNQRFTKKKYEQK